MNGLRVEHLDLAKQSRVLGVVDLDPCVFPRKEEDLVWTGMVEGEGGYGAEGITVLQLCRGLALRVSVKVIRQKMKMIKMRGSG